jgi:hypothetical protein
MATPEPCGDQALLPVQAILDDTEQVHLLSQLPSDLASLLRPTRYSPEVLPIVAVTGVAAVGAGWYISRLARGPDVVWDRKNNPQPWNVSVQAWRWSGAVMCKGAQ